MIGDWPRIANSFFWGGVVTAPICIRCLGPMGFQIWSEYFCRDCAVFVGLAPPRSQCEECNKIIGWKYPPGSITAALRALLDAVWSETPESERPIYFMDIPPKSPYKGTGRGNLFEVVKSIDILGFARDFTTLRPVGKDRFKGRCPVHAFREQTGSFYIFADKQTWRCFGACAAGGDIIELARRLMDTGHTV